jgi:hypothetical protein
MLAFTAGRLLTPTDVVEHPLLLVEQGRVVEISREAAGRFPPEFRCVRFRRWLIAPGYVDLHIHGSAGYDVMDDSADALPAIEHCSHGMGSRVIFQPPSPLRWRQLCARWNDWRTRSKARTRARTTRSGRAGSPAVPLGIHLEGTIHQPCAARGASAGKSAGADSEPCSSSSGRRRAAAFA